MLGLTFENLYVAPTCPLVPDIKTGLLNFSLGTVCDIHETETIRKEKSKMEIVRM
jgi:hypothetical protein